VFFLASGCDQPHSFSVQLPESDYHNAGYNRKDFIRFLTITQYSDTSVLLDYDTCLITSIDSSLHIKMFNLISEDFELGSRLIMRLYLDHDMPIQTFRQLMLECRKIDLVWIWMITADSLPLAMALMPIFDKQHIYIDPQIERHVTIPPPPLWSKRDLLQSPNLKIDVSHRSIRINDFEGTPISDFRTYMMENPQTIIVYQLDSTCTYQDFVSLHSLVFSTINRVRSELTAADTSLSEQEIKRLHPIRFLDFEELQLTR
jgi:hypothetical protein